LPSARRDAVTTDLIHRVREAERDLIGIYGLLEGIQRTVDQQTVTLAHQSVLQNSHTVGLDRVEKRVEGLEHRLRGVEDRLDGLGRKIDGLRASTASTAS
jgi:hypothetical protein